MTILPNKLQNRKYKHMWFNAFFVKIKYYKDKVAGWKFCSYRS